MSYFNEFPNTRTYDSDLGWLISKVTEINTEMQSFVDFQNTIQNSFNELQLSFDALSAKVDSWETELAAFQADIQSQIERQNTNIERQFLQIKADIAAELAKQLADFSAQINNLRSYTDAELMLNRVYVDTVIQNFIDSIPDLTTIEVINPVRNGLLTPIQMVVDDLYDMIVRVDALTASEYDSILLTAEEYDNLGLTAWIYDTEASKYIQGASQANLLYMNNPFTGIFEPVRNVVNYLARFHMNGITAAAYDALSLTASEYDGRMYTAYTYDVIGITP